MATITERLKWLIEADGTSAVKGFQSVGTAADKELTKTQSHLDAVGSKMTKTGAGAMAFAGVAGAALVKAAGSFEELGLKAGKMSDATGLSVDQASRWIEVAGDMGIGADTVEGAIGKMNKTLGGSPEKFAALGIEMATTKTGVEDVNGTFLNAIDRLNGINDPATRAAAAAQIFGKGWQDSAELLKLSTDDIKAQLASVSDQKVINEDELAMARDYRASLDELKDSAENLALSIGKSAAPVIGGFASGLSHAADAFTNVNEATGGAAGTFLTFGTAAIGAAGAISFVAGQAIKMRSRFTDDVTGSLNTAGKAATGFATGLALVGTTMAGLEIVNALTVNTNRAKDAMNEFINDSGHIVDVGAHTQDLLDNWQKMSESVDRSKGLWDRTLGDLPHAFDQSGENLSHLQEGFDKLMDTSPKLAAETVSAMEATARAAKAGDEAAQHWLDKNSLSTNVIKGFREEVDNAAGAVEVLSGRVDTSVESAHNATKANEFWATASDDVKRSTEQATRATEAHEREMEQFSRHARFALDQVMGKWDELSGDISADESLLNLQTSFDEVHDKAVDAFTAAANHADDAEQKVRDAKLATDGLKQSVIDYGKNVADLPPERVTRMLADIDQGKLQQVEAELEQLARDRTANVNVTFKGAPVGGGVKLFAKGGPASGPAIVGEDGPEFVDLPPGSFVHTAAQTRSMLSGGTAVASGGTTINVHLTVMGMIKTDREMGRYLTDVIIDAQRRGEIPAGWAA